MTFILSYSSKNYVHSQKIMFIVKKLSYRISNSDSVVVNKYGYEKSLNLDRFNKALSQDLTCQL